MTVTAPPAPTSITIAVRVTDAVGFSATDTATVQGQYFWSGFLAPVDDLPTPNAVKAGQAVPVTFSLGGDQGLGILLAGYPAVSGPVPCSSAPADPVETTETAGHSELRYDATADAYTYVWKTDRTWANSCRFLTIKLDDGTTHQALFQFRR